MKARKANVKPFGVYRGQVVAVDSIHEHTSTVIDGNDVRLVVKNDELEMSLDAIVAVMKGADEA